MKHQTSGLKMNDQSEPVTSWKNKQIPTADLSPRLHILRRKYLLVVVIVIIVSLLEPLEMVMSKGMAKRKKSITLRNGSLAFLTFLLVSLSTYFLLT